RAAPVSAAALAMPALRKLRREKLRSRIGKILSGRIEIRGLRILPTERLPSLPLGRKACPVANRAMAGPGQSPEGWATGRGHARRAPAAPWRYLLRVPGRWLTAS